jgi:hypothetical protein
MADVATPSGAAMFNGSAPEKKRAEKPEKPDQAAYDKELSKAKKAHEEAKAKFVSIMHCAHTHSIPTDYNHIVTISDIHYRML